MKKLLFLGVAVLVLAVFTSAGHAEETKAELDLAENVESVESLAVVSPAATRNNVEEQQPKDNKSSAPESGNLLEHYGVCWNDR